jgi:hypothetical protein
MPGDTLMTRKPIAEKLVEALGAATEAMRPAVTRSKPLSEMPETPLLVLPETNRATAIAPLRRN